MTNLTTHDDAPTTPPGASIDAYAELGVRPLINACGIYTDLGGSTLEPELWEALGPVNRRWASMLDLLDRTGERIASLVGTEAARVVPGASAAIALATATCVARHDDALIDTLPVAGDRPRTVLQQVVHRYKYTRCALLGGGVVREVGGEDGTTAAQMTAALETGDVVAVLHPAHLDEAPGGLGLERVVTLAREHDVPVIVDAAYQVYPVELIGSYARRGADLTCISSKYFLGPNAGGFLAGRRALVERAVTLDFTQFESGRFRTFGRGYKLDRTTVVATMLALQRWMALDHQERWASYARRAEGLLAELRARGVGAGARVCGFTFTEDVVEGPVNAVHLPSADGAVTAAALAAGAPAVRCIDLPDGVLFCTECVADAEVAGIADAVGALGTTASR